MSLQDLASDSGGQTLVAAVRQTNIPEGIVIASILDLGEVRPVR